MIWVRIMEWAHNHFDQADFQIDARVPGAILWLAGSVINLKLLADWDAEYGSALYKSFIATRLKPVKTETGTWSKIFGMRWKSSIRRLLSWQYQPLRDDQRPLLYNNGHFRPRTITTNGSQLENPDISGAIFTLSLTIRIRVRNHEKIRARKKSCTISRFVHDKKITHEIVRDKNRARFFWSKMNFDILF